MGWKRVDVSLVLRGHRGARSSSEPLTANKGQKGHVLMDLRKKDGKWRVRDIDFRTPEEAIARQRDFLEGHPDAKAVRDK